MTDLERDRVKLPRVGDTVSLTRDSTGKRHEVTWLGFSFERSVVITAPTTAAGLVLVEQDEGVAVRYFRDNHINGFKSCVLQVARYPYAYLHLDYPEAIAEHRIRETARVPVDLRGRITTESGAQDVEIVDLSDRGARIRLEEGALELAAALTLHLEIPFAGEREAVDLPCEVRNRVAGPDEGRGGGGSYGLAFQEIGKDLRIVLTGFIYEQLSRRRVNL